MRSATGCVGGTPHLSWYAPVFLARPETNARAREERWGSAMIAYSLCALCQCYVKVGESQCPFCGVANDPPLRPAPKCAGALPARRAGWVACASSTLALLGCGGTEAAAVHTTMDAAVGDLDSSMSGAEVPLGAWLTPGTGAFVCSFNDTDAGTCDRSRQWCYTFHGFVPTGCVSFADTCDTAEQPGCDPSITWDPALCDGGIRRCACITTGCECLDDDAGGITVSCGSCYGAPPAPDGRDRRRSRRARTLQVRTRQFA